MSWFRKSTFALTAALALLVSQLLVVTAAVSPDGFRQDQRINQLTLQYSTDTFATSNAFGNAIKASVQGSMQSSIDASVTSGSTSLLFEMPGLGDLTGTSNPSFQIGTVNAAPVTSPNAYNGNSDLDWWYTPNSTEIDATGLPLSQLSASIAAKVLTGSGQRVPLVSALGAGSSLTLSTVKLGATIGASSALSTSTGSSPGHLQSELLDPAITSFATMGSGQLSGNISAASLATSPIPTTLVAGATTPCTEGYTSSNSWLDLLVGGCHVLGGFILAVSLTQPDQVDPSAPPAGAGAPYALVRSGNAVSGCKDHLGTTVVLSTCLAAAAYSSYFTFTTDRVIGKGPAHVAPDGLSAANVTPSTFTLFWYVPTDATAFSVKQASTVGGPYVEVASTVNAFASIASLTPHTTYYFVVASITASGDSTNSAPLAVTTHTLPPSSLTATGVSGAIDLSWSSVTGATSYTVLRSTVAGGPHYEVATGIVGTTYHDAAVTPGAAYFYVVDAVDAGGPSDDSPEASAIATPVTPTSLPYTEYAANSTQPTQIITGPDSLIWYTTLGGEAVVEVYPSDAALHNTFSTGGFGLACQPSGIALGSDHNVWVACTGALDSLIRIRLSDGSVTKVGPLWSTGFGPQLLTSGPDGNLWFPTANYIARFNPTTHAFHRFVLPGTTSTRADAIAVGTDGKLWFTEGSRNRIGRMTLAGVVTEFVIPTPNSHPHGIAVGQDGNMYFTETSANQIGRITPSGSIGHVAVGASPSFITAGPDGNLWFTEPTANKIGSVTPSSGMLQESSIPTASSGLYGLAAGPDGNLWFAESSTDKIGKVGVRLNVLSLDKTAVAFGNVPVGSTTAAQSVVLTNTGPNALAAFTPVIATSGTGGTFAITLDQCNTAPIPAGSSCEVDVHFTSTGATGTVAGALTFQVDAGLATEQTLNVGLAATVIPATCDSVAITPSVTSPQNVGTAVNLVATAAGCPDASPLYRFYLRNPAGVWSIVRSYGTSDTFAWNTTSYTPGTYLIGVWVKDAKSTKTYDAYAFGTFTLQRPACTSTSLTSDVASPQAGSTTVNFTATAADCPSPLYQWWVRNALGVWSIASAFPSSDTFAWNTTGLVNGTYQVGVWAKQSGSTKSYEAFAFVTYTLTTVPVTGTTHCKAVNVVPTAASPSTVGTPLTFTASAQGCDTPEFRWWVRNTAAIWATVQAYPGTNTLNWSTTGLPPGTYLLGVWVRQAGSTAPWEAYSFITYTLLPDVNTTPCTSVNIAPDNASPQPAGLMITFSATALGCYSPNYRFFIAPPGGAFAQVQAYSQNSTYAWDTAGLKDGPYQVGVWVRHRGTFTSPAYEAFAFITFQLHTVVSPPCVTLSMWPTSGGGLTTNDSTSQSPQPAGKTITWIASEDGCAIPNYQFYVIGPGTPIDVLQTYTGASNAPNTVVWDTAGLPRGTYEVVVELRLFNSTKPYELIAVSIFELT